MFRLMLICVAILTASVAHAQTPSPTPGATLVETDELSGLWKAKKRLGPTVRGPLIIYKDRSRHVADVMGRRVPVRTEKGELTFDLPNELGTFRGKLEGTRILGHWFLPRTLWPVVLRQDGADRWRGEVDPPPEDFTFYLLLRKRRDGTMGAVLRNPEFDYGSQRNVDRLVQDADGLKLMGKWRGREMAIATGSFDPETRVMTLIFPNRGGSYDFRRDTDDSEFYPRGKDPGRYIYHAPSRLDDGWPTATLAEVNIDRPGVERFVQKLLDMPMDSHDAPQIHGILIARHGRLVLEEYFHGEHRDKVHMTRSAAKSVTAILVGAAIHAGAPLKLSSPVYQVMNDGSFPAGLEPQKRTMTLEHLLTMSSGYFCDDTNEDAPGNEEKMWDQTDEPDFYRYTLKVPLATPPGENAVYCSSSPNLALGMVGRATGESPVYSFDRLIGGPMKINRYAWLTDPAGNPYGGGGVQFLPRDFLKFGQLMLDGGTWEGRRILGRDFVARATARLYHLRKIYYGYQWWNEDYPYKNRTVQTFRATGAGGQSITVVPELGLVVAVYAGNYNNRIQGWAQQIVPRFILPAVREAADDRNAPVTEREFNSPYGRSNDGSRVSKPK
ncbi:MAG TPA: serine hydrolase [Pyrinomonadaceae bacterium]|nr:serine hydrolase [Pyrinomonadaceae bacterium]